MLFFHTLEPQHRIFCSAELIPGCGQLEFHLVELTLGFLQFCLCHQFLLLQLLFLLGELFQLIGAGQDARFFIDRTAGHGTAGVHDLAVQGYDLEPVAVLLGHGDGGIDVMDDYRSAQQVFHNLAIPGIGTYQLGGNAHKAPAVFQVVFLQSLSLDIGQRQEGGATAAGTF